MNQKHIFPTFCSYDSSKLNKAVKRPGKHYISNFKRYFPASQGDINFSQKVIVVLVAQILTGKEKKRGRARSERQKCINISFIDSKGNIVQDVFFCIQIVMQPLITGSQRAFFFTVAVRAEHGNCPHNEQIFNCCFLIYTQ